jgi:hypothetical protein
VIIPEVMLLLKKAVPAPGAFFRGDSHFGWQSLIYAIGAYLYCSSYVWQND